MNIKKGLFRLPLIRQASKVSKRCWVYSISIISAVILLVIIYLLYCRVEPAEIILTATAVTIYVYTYETYELRRATVEHTEIYTKPVLILNVEPDATSTKVHLWLHNSGNSPAYNVELNDSRLKCWIGLEAIRINLYLANIGIVPPEGKIEIFLGDGINQDKSEPFTERELLELINSALRDEGEYSIETTVIYDDILGHSWKSDLGYNSMTGIISKKPEAMKREIERKENKKGEPIKGKV